MSNVSPARAAVPRSQESQSRSASNVLRLLLMLADRGQLRVINVADELGVAPSTAHRLLATLTQSGLAARNEDRCYVQGPAFARLRLPPSHPDAMLAVFVPHLTRLAEATGETTHLMIRQGTAVRFIDSVEGPAALRVASRAGMVMPAHLTSGGKALLAVLGDEAIRELYAKGVPKSPNSRIETVDDLLAEIAVVRERGYAVNRDQSEPGISAIGVAVHRNGVPAAISISMPSVRYRRDRTGELVAILSGTAAAISAQP
jgi:IclR family transcriptional regulator, acetate operon repressor